MSWHFSSAERIANTLARSKDDMASPKHSDEVGDSFLKTGEQQLTDITEAINQIKKMLDMKQDKLVDVRSIQSVQESDLLAVEPYEEQDSAAQQEFDRQEADLHYEEKINALQTQLGEESVDEAWFTEVGDDVYRAIEKHSDRYVLDNLVCGSSICKLDASMKFINGESDFSSGHGVDRLIHGEMAWAGQSLFEQDTETGKITVFLIKKGEVTSEEG